MFAQYPRRREPELMDAPDLDAGLHRAALSGLARINLFSASAGILWPALKELQVRLNRPIRVLDIATGGGDVPISLWSRARHAGIALVLDGCDISPTAIDCASRRAAVAGADARFFHLDVLHDPIPDGYDALVCSLFLHHLDERDALQVLHRMGQAAKSLVLINDLARSRTGLVLAHVATRLLSRSPIVHTDGPRSVNAAFTPEEICRLAAQAGLHGATVARRWPCRFLLSWERDG
jgi:2-polyprenyl-3-methyl-5-hydroxy-6-metoxy-1,4-benzoquinol methylase